MNHTTPAIAIKASSATITTAVAGRIHGAG
jgi:hypothetical protein